MKEINMLLGLALLRLEGENLILIEYRGYFGINVYLSYKKN